MVYIISTAIICVLWILYLNKGSEKILNVWMVILTTTLATGLGSLLVILRPEARTQEFVTVFFYDSKGEHPLLVESYPIRKRFGIESPIWAERTKAQASTQNPASLDANNLLLDFLMRCVVERLFARFYHSWSVEAKSWRVPGADQSEWGPSNDADRLPSAVISKDDVLRKMGEQGNTFAAVRAETGGLSGKMSVPLKTEVTYSADQMSRELRFKNPFVNMVIKATFSSMHVLQHGYYDVFEVDKTDPDRYRQVSFKVRIKADLSSWRAGWEMMTHHKRWVDSVITLLSETFDWDKADREIREAWTERQLQKL